MDALPSRHRTTKAGSRFIAQTAAEVEAGAGMRGLQRADSMKGLIPSDEIQVTTDMQVELERKGSEVAAQKYAWNNPNGQ